jgi:hypothetical protein
MTSFAFLRGRSSGASSSERPIPPMRFHLPHARVREGAVDRVQPSVASPGACLPRRTMGTHAGSTVSTYCDRLQLWVRSCGVSGESGPILQRPSHASLRSPTYLTLVRQSEHHSRSLWCHRSPSLGFALHSPSALASLPRRGEFPSVSRAWPHDWSSLSTKGRESPFDRPILSPVPSSFSPALKPRGSPHAPPGTSLGSFCPPRRSSVASSFR